MFLLLFYFARESNMLVFFVCLFVYLPEKAICMLTPFHCNGSSGQYAEISSMSIMPIMIEYIGRIAPNLYKLKKWARAGAPGGANEAPCIKR